MKKFILGLFLVALFLVPSTAVAAVSPTFAKPGTYWEATYKDNDFVTKLQRRSATDWRTFSVTVNGNSAFAGTPYSISGALETATEQAYQSFQNVPAPTAEFTWSPQNPSSPPVQVSFTNTGTCSATPCTYSWAHPEVFATTKDASFTYQNAGTKTVTLTVTDAKARSANVTHSFTVASAPPPPPLCSNGLDDDQDGKTDYPADPGCTSASDNDESDIIQPPPGNNCMADPSVCGYPDVETTGLSNPAALTTVNGNVTLNTAGQIYQDKLVNGSITVTAPDVTIRNVKVVTQGWAIVCRVQQPNCLRLNVQNTEINLNGDLDGYGIVYDNYTADHVLVHNGADCYYMGVNATVKNSMCTLGPDTNGDGWEDNKTFCQGTSAHFDAVSSDGGGPHLIDHNTLRNPCSQTSAILESTNTSAIHDVTITNNLVAGGGWTVYCDAGPNVTGTWIFNNNRIAKTYWKAGQGDPSSPGGGYYGPASACSQTQQHTGNVWDEDGSPVPLG